MPDCPECGATVDADAIACPSCGANAVGATASFNPVTSDEGASAVSAAEVEGPVLVVRKGPQAGERFFIDRPRLTIGRDPESDIFLNDMTVSRIHSIIDLEGHVVKVTDAGSLNGTYVNGELVDNAELNHGDTVQIGTFQMVFFCVADGER